MSQPATTEDRFLGGSVILRQPTNGFRAGMDSILLAAAVTAGPGARLLEIGCGAGAALLAVATLNPHIECVGVEAHEEGAALAKTNVALNALEDRVTILHADPLADPSLDLGPSFDGAFCNPPFNAKGRTPDPERAHAHLTPHTVQAWVNAFANRLKGGAPLVMIHRAEALHDVLTACQGRLGGVQVRPIQPFADQPAHRILVRATKGSRAALRLLPALVLHEAHAKHTHQADAILRGAAGLSWL
ncbi:MAG: tRNA1(Val) (adenine(37)-N6)-methyltransferase [Caulobacterales bacterium]